MPLYIYLPAPLGWANPGFSNLRLMVVIDLGLRKRPTAGDAQERVVYGQLYDE